MQIQERVQALRRKMAERGLEAYIVPSSDPHQSEYLCDYYKTREYISGFSGSAGIAVITRTKAGLWTDGRYFLQAGEELKDGPFQLYRLGIDIPLLDFLKKEVSPFGKIGFDGYCMSLENYTEFAKGLGQRMLVADVDYIGEIWEDRPSLPKAKAFFLDEKYSGKSVEDKLEVLRYMMKTRQIDYHFISSPEDICYLLNIRGRDVKNTPVILSYALISQEKAMLFVDGKKLEKDVIQGLEEADVTIFEYEGIQEKLEDIEGQKIVYLQPSRTNIFLFQKIKDNVKIQRGLNLTSLMKAIKNETEIENLKEAYTKDGVALVKFFNWVETGAKTGNINEKFAVERLNQFRDEDEDFLEDSFDAIIGYAENAAIIHYNPSSQPRSKSIENRGLLLVDSGGQYYQGTTDITRTYAMGALSYEEQQDYTLVLKSHIAGMRAVFLEGTTGNYIDSLCKQPIWQAKKDYNHGTGHGVGYLLSVHEGPQTFSKRDGGVEIAPGMVTSIEPGLYIANSHGIRLESIVLCVKDEKNVFGQFLSFEPLTWLPLDTRPVLRSLLDQEEIDWLNEYNKTSYEKLAPYLEDMDLEYLEKITQEI